MFRWIDIIRTVKTGNATPPSKVSKSKEEWEKELTEEEFVVSRLKGTERPFSSSLCTSFEAGLYACKCCKTILFDSNKKFDSGTGWPSFDRPVTNDVVAYHVDDSYGMQRVEVTCNVCDAHLGHVFPDGPDPTGLRFCINAIALKKVEKTDGVAYLGGGCFWCTEAVFLDVKGVKSVKSGYAGGQVRNPTYREVCSGNTGHAELVEVVFDPNVITLETIFQIHLVTHDPTTLNRQGADKGTQYRSVIFYQNEEEKNLAKQSIDLISSSFNDPIVTTLEKLDVFYEAEAYHQNYYNTHPEEGYCQIVIAPKIAKFRQHLVQYLK